MYGCLSLLLLGVVFIFIAAVMGLLQILFSIRRSANAFRQTINGEGPRKKKRPPVRPEIRCPVQPMVHKITAMTMGNSSKRMKENM